MLRRNYDGVNISWDLRSVRAPRVTIGQVVYRPGGYCGPRVQRDWELVLLHSGACRARVNQAWRDLAVGQVALFRPGRREFFRFAPETETHHSWCSVRPAFLPVALRRELAAAPFSAPVSEVFQRILSAAFLLRDAAAPEAARVVESLGLALCAEFLDMVRRQRPENRTDEAVARALRHMEDHYGAESCLRDAHRAAGCSRNTLIARFASVTGSTPGRYLWQWRVEKGLALLTETGLTVAEIAYRCGFKNPFHFSRCVRRRQGASPREIRRRAWSAALPRASAVRR